MRSSFLARFHNYTGRLVAGLPIHRLDGLLRILYGLIAGLLIFFAMQANVVIGFASESNKSIPWLFYFMAMVSGSIR